MQNQGGHNIAGHDNFFNNPPSGVSYSQDSVKNEATTGEDISTVPKDDASDL